MKWLRIARREIGMHNTADPTEKVITHLKHIRITYTDILNEVAEYKNREVYLSHEVKMLGKAIEQRNCVTTKQSVELDALLRLLKDELQTQSCSKATVMYITTTLKILE